MEDPMRALAGLKGPSTAFVLATRRLEFRLVSSLDAKYEALKKKYRAVNPTEPRAPEPALPTSGDPKPKGGALAESPVGPTLFPVAKLSNGWPRSFPTGTGLHNTGNTCFLNSVLQCLTYSPALCGYLLSKDHSKSCRMGNRFCMMCVLQDHVFRVFESKKPFVPYDIIRNLKAIAKHFHRGRQEDAHEFLRYVIESMQKSALLGHEKADPKVKLTTLPHALFGGLLRSRIKCSPCGHCSDTNDPMLDLSLEIKSCDSLEKALRLFTKLETLDGANKYKCEKCKKLVPASKQITIHKPPRLLTIHLKRFDFTRAYGSKINRPVVFPPSLNLAPYMSDKSSSTGSMYSLYGVLVHSGNSCGSGHYYCYVKASNGAWHCMNDSEVEQTSLKRALSQPAYILFYSQSDEAGPFQNPTPPSSPAISAARPQATPQAQNRSVLASKVLQFAKDKLPPQAPLGRTLPTLMKPQVIPIGAPHAKMPKLSPRPNHVKSGSANIRPPPVSIQEDMGERLERPLGTFQPSLRPVISKPALDTPPPSPLIPSRLVVPTAALHCKSRHPSAVVAPPVQPPSPTAQLVTPQISPILPASQPLPGSVVFKQALATASAKAALSPKVSVKAFETRPLKTASRAAALPNHVAVAWDENNASKKAKLELLMRPDRHSSNVVRQLEEAGTAQDDAWDTTSASDLAKRAAIERALKPAMKRPSTYDQDYDRGKVKKLKANKINAIGNSAWAIRNLKPVPGSPSSPRRTNPFDKAHFNFQAKKRNSSNNTI